MLKFDSIPFSNRPVPAEVKIVRLPHGFEVRHDFGAFRFSKFSDIPLRYRERSFSVEVK